MNFATGPLGYRYIDTSTTPTLVNAGSQSAYQAGFDYTYYIYTILANQTPDGSAGNGDPVDIGFHYTVLYQPYASDESAQVCRGNSVPLTLNGYSYYNPFVTYSVLTQPQHGTLSGTAPSLTYTETDLNFLGPDTFTYKVNDGYLDSPPATVTITVGDPSPRAYGLDVITQVGCSTKIILSGSDICTDPLTFNIQSYPTHGTLGTLTQINPTNASVVYTPSSGFTGVDNFSFTVNDGVGSQTAYVQITVGNSSVVLITGNNAALGFGPIDTFNFTDGSEINSFTPQGATGANTPNGRGLAINTTTSGTEIFYTEYLTRPNNTTYTDFIHVCSYGTEGSGYPFDSRTLSNPDQRIDDFGNSASIATLTVHYDSAQGKNELYVLTGYGLDAPLKAEVFELDPITGNKIGNPVTIQTPIDPEFSEYSSSDGFTVLPNGDFLINDWDGAIGGAVYREYYGFNPPPGKTAGTLVTGGLQIDPSKIGSGFYYATGIAIAPDGNSLYFMANDYLGNPTVVKTDLSGNPLENKAIGSSFENIGVFVPQCQ
jgi:hypothetical protein